MIDRGHINGPGRLNDKLNGRAVPGAVWVRPEMPELAREMRTRYPDQYPEYADPAPYAEHGEREDDPVRPYVGARAQVEAREMTPVAFLKTPARSREDGECPCGIHASWAEYNATKHTKAHMQWSTGVPIPRNLVWHGGNIAVVTATSPVTWRKLGFQCALLPKRENGYDFASFDVGNGEASEANLRAYLYRAGERVIGFVSVVDSTKQWWHAFDSTNKPRPRVGTTPPCRERDLYGGHLASAGHRPGHG